MNTKRNGLNGMMLQGFEWDLPADGRHWRYLATHAGELAAMGVTAIWLPPACKGSGGGLDVGYGVYDLYDLGEFDQKGSVRTKYGTAREYRQAVRALKLAGIQVLADVVLNHRMGGDEKEEVYARWVDPDNRLNMANETAPAVVYTRYTFPGRGGLYSDFKWDHTCFTGTDYNELDPAHHLFLFEGKQWAPDVDGEKGNYDYLMGNDVDVRDPKVEQELIRWALWYLAFTGVDGFRLDAVKHISAEFYRRFLTALRKELGRELYAVGEYWHADDGALHHYLNQVQDAMDLFDVPLHFHLMAASRSGGSYDMRNLFQGTLVAGRAMNSVTFVDNHDTQPGQSLESWVDGWFKQSAYGLILLRREGYPCVFWGDLYGIPTHGIGAVPDLRRMMRIRSETALGEERDYFDDADIIGFTRLGLDEVPGSGLAFVCTNAAGGLKRMYVGERYAGKLFRCVLGGQQAALVDREGYAMFRCADGACSIYLPPLSAKTVLYRLRRAVPRLLRRGAVYLLNRLHGELEQDTKPQSGKP